MIWNIFIGFVGTIYKSYLACLFCKLLFVFLIMLIYFHNTICIKLNFSKQGWVLVQPEDSLQSITQFSHCSTKGESRAFCYIQKTFLPRNQCFSILYVMLQLLQCVSLSCRGTGSKEKISYINMQTSKPLYGM